MINDGLCEQENKKYLCIFLIKYLKILIFFV